MTLLLALSTSDRGETATWLSRLESHSASERGAAQRWLAANLERDDFEALHQAALRGGPEASRRIASVLSSSERHFELAALLGVDERAQVAAVGRDALLELASAWSTETEKEGARRYSVMAELSKRTRTQFALDPRARGMAETFELLTNANDSGVTLVLDPDLLNSRAIPELDPRTEPMLEGDEGELLGALARSYSLGFDGFGLDDPGDMAWIRVCRRLREGKSSGRELLVEWSLRVARNEDAADARLCARALVGTGWPAAITWLEQRWFTRQDETALSGLRLLASRGLVSPSMRTKSVQAAWLSESRWRNSMQETARALGSLGARTAVGEDLEPELLKGWDALDARSRWIRLVALELRGFGSSASHECVRSILNSPNATPAMYNQALRTGVALGMKHEQRPKPDQLRAAFRYADSIHEGRELVQLLLRLAVEPLEGLAVAERMALCEWYFLAGRADLAGPLLIELAQSKDVREHPASCALVARLREWQRAGYGDELRTQLESLHLERVQLHLGLLGAEATERFLDEMLPAADPGEPGGPRAAQLTGPELQSLAALAAGSRGSKILDLLAEREAKRAGGSTDPALEEALTEAVRVLREARLDILLENFVLQMRRLGRPDSWPPPPLSAAVALRLFERRFEP